jgi:hypothetical protein
MAGIDLTARARKYALYLPAMQLGSATRICMEPGQWRDLPPSVGLDPCDFNYLSPRNRFWSYTCALASAETFRNHTNNAITSRDPSSFILADSGGYQIGKGSGETRKWRGYSEREVSEAWRRSSILKDEIDWCELHGDGAMTTDIPLWVKRAKFKGTPFHKCSVRRLLELTVENLEFLQRIPDKRCKYLNVYQGDKPADEEAWSRGVKPFKFDGSSFAGGVGVDGGPFRILNRLLIMQDQKLLDPGFNWLHLLKLSQFPWAPMMTAIQRAVRRYVKNSEFIVTFDSSTPYLIVGQGENYLEARTFTSDPNSWSNRQHKFPSNYGHATTKTKIALNTTTCVKTKCFMCAQGMPHLTAPLTSPIAKRLHTADLVTNKNKHVIRRGGVLFDEALINHNVYTVVDGIIRANEAVFDAKPHAPQQLIDAVGIIEDDLFRVQNWRGLLNKNRLLLEDAVGFKAGKDVL